MDTQQETETRPNVLAFQELLDAIDSPTISHEDRIKVLKALLTFIKTKND
jgi:hypothetical protein